MTRPNLYSALFCIFLFSFGAMSQPFNNQTNCNKEPNSYQSNLITVVSTLRNRSSLGSYYANATAGHSPNIVYGMYLCLGNISNRSCSNCVHSSVLDIHLTCDSRSLIMFSDDCIVRYSDVSFFSLVEDAPATSSHAKIDSLESLHFFNQTLPGKIDELIIRASSSLSSLVPYFVEDKQRVTQVEGSYDLQAMVQCSPDLDSNNCTICLRRAVEDIFECCSQARWARIFFSKCVVRYNVSSLQPNESSLGKGNEIFGNTFIAIMTAFVVLALTEL